MIEFPPLFLDRLKKIIPTANEEGLGVLFGNRSQVALRLNPLKASIEEMKKTLRGQEIMFKKTTLEEALLIPAQIREKLMQLDAYREGKIYLQGLSSQFISRILDPQPGDRVLDMCAAPGSKTSHMAAIMKNQGNIVALEKVVGRYHKLKSVLRLLGATNVEPKCLDAKRFRPSGQFDKILVDAPCSSEGRFRSEDPESFAYWSLRKIKEMKTKQKGILLRGVQLLAAHGTLVYSTCTFAPEENEEVVNWVLRKMEGKIELLPIHSPDVPQYPALVHWGKKTFSDELHQCLRIKSDEIWDAFFVAKIRRKA